MPDLSRSGGLPTWFSTRQGRAASLLAVVVVAAWFALPALFMAYTEGFQSQVAINAHALRLGEPGLGDSLYPFNGRFFLLTQLGDWCSATCHAGRGSAFRKAGHEERGRTVALRRRRGGCSRR